MELVNERNVFIDNLKGILIFLVVLGHTIELYMYDNFVLFMIWIYIYCFHMPLFVYISGFLSKDAEKAQKKAFERFLLPYLVWNSFYFIFITLVQRKLNFSFLYPWFANWYFLSLFTMCLVLPILIKIRRCVPAAFCMSIAAGFFSEFGGLFSFSRTVCFSGFFLLGYYSNMETLEKIKRNRMLILILGVITMILIYVYCSSGIMEKTALARSLTKSASYKIIEMSLTKGSIARAITILISLIMGSMVLAYSPGGRNIFTQAGKNSIIILIFHKYFIMIFEKIVREMEFNIHTIIGMILLVTVSIGITLLLSINILRKIHDKIMEIIGIIVKKR